VPPGSGSKLACPRCLADLPLLNSALQETSVPSGHGSFTEINHPVNRVAYSKWLMFVGVPMLCVYSSCIVCGILFSPQEKKSAVQKIAPDEITNSIGMKFRRIPAGRFLMGSPTEEKGRFDDERQREVEITKPFYLAVHEVTQEQYERIMETNRELLFTHRRWQG
jgi:formylglycine-generating enzyme required for sulfatase activity